MKDQLPRYLMPTADMRKAIDRNTKQDEDLSLVLEQLDKEKKMALKQIVRRQEAFKKQILKRRESLPQKISAVQVYGNGQKTADRERPHLEELTQTKRPIHRTVSLDETCSTSSEPLSVLIKRHSLPDSPFPRHNSADSIHFTSKPGAVLSSRQQTDNVLIMPSIIYHQKKSWQEYKEGDPKDTTVDQAGIKLQGNTFKNAIRRHSDVTTMTAVETTSNQRLLQRRKLSEYSEVSSNKTYINESLTRL